jgi:hypothetical protein
MWHLKVERKDFRRAIAVLARGRTDEKGEVTLTFAEGELEIATTVASHAIPAEGEWSGSVTVSPVILRALKGRLPAGTPLELIVRDNHLHVGSFSVSCVIRPVISTTPAEPPPACTREMLALAASRSPDEIDALGLQTHLIAATSNASQYINRASAVLAKLKVRREAIEALVKQTIAEPRHPLTEHEHWRIDAIADAWKALAPLGASVEDIRDLVDRAVREGWKT